MTGAPKSTGLTLDEALAQAHWTRREFMTRVAALGVATALTQLLIACGQPAASPSAAPATATPAPTTAAVATPTAAPTPVPPPESELVVYNWLDYIGEGVIESFE